MSTYTVTMNTADEAAFLADPQGNVFCLRADGVKVTFDDSAREWLAGRPDTDDGHIDSDGNLWFDGDPHRVVSI